jgi:hypothetical protein
MVREGIQKIKQTARSATASHPTAIPDTNSRNGFQVA